MLIIFFTVFKNKNIFCNTKNILVQSSDIKIVEEEVHRKIDRNKRLTSLEAFKSHINPFYSKDYRKNVVNNKRKEGLTMKSVNREILKIIARSRYVDFGPTASTF